MYRKKEVGSTYYLLGQGLLLVSIIFHTLNLLSIIPPSDINKFFVPIGLIFDVIFLSFAQYHKTKDELLELEKKKEVLLEQSRFSSIGQAIGHITHQWKHPLTKLGSSITLLETINIHQKENLSNTWEKQLPSITNNIKLMKNTLDEFSQYYATNIAKSNFLAKESIDNLLKILNSRIILKNVEITINENNIDTLHNYEHIFSNIMLILLNNSMDEFTQNKQNTINIEIEKNNKNIIIIYSDNAGGIKLNPIEQVFEYFVTTKQTNNNSGMGLSIAKMLIEDRLKGTINVQNTKDGVCFTIKLPSV